MAASTTKSIFIHSFSWIILLTLYRVLSKGWYVKVIAICCNDCMIIAQLYVIVYLFPCLQFERRFVHFVSRNRSGRSSEYYYYSNQFGIITNLGEFGLFCCSVEFLNFVVSNFSFLPRLLSQVLRISVIIVLQYLTLFRMKKYVLISHCIWEFGLKSFGRWMKRVNQVSVSIHLFVYRSSQNIYGNLKGGVCMYLTLKRTEYQKFPSTKYFFM